jgi:Mg-chelatase subunit ChlD
MILAAGGLAVWSGDAPMTVVVALDRSASIPLPAQERALSRVVALRGAMRTGDRLGLVSFGADAATEWRPLEAPPPGELRATVSESGTDIGAAFRLARSLLPQGQSRILLMSDGRDTAGRAEREAWSLAGDGIPVDVVPPAIDHLSLPLQVTRVTAPTTAPLGAPYLLSVEVSGRPGARGPLIVYRDDREIGRTEVTVGADRTASVSLTERPAAAGAHTYRASIEAEDGQPDRHGAGAVVVVEGPPAILYVSDSSPMLVAVLAGAGFRVTRTRPEDVTGSTASLSPFAGVIVDDVPADRFAPGAIEGLADYVENTGGGLLILGTARSLTLSGYPATPLSRILPVDLRPRTGQRATPVELVLVFDKSGSMAEIVGGVSKIEVARQAVTEAVGLMPGGDAIGVLAFDSGIETVAPLAVTRDEAALREALGRVRPGGSTAIAPALDTALRWLRAPDRPRAARRHIVLISDGRTSDDDAARVLSLARAGGVEISAVAIGSNANRSLLEELARSTGGRAYFPANLRELPQAVRREAARSTAGGVVRERFTLRAAAHPVMAGIATPTLPPLTGYVVSATRPSATAILFSHLDDPILAAWSAGLGRVAVFTADLASAWSAPLRSWRDNARMWTQTVRWLSRKETDPALRVQIRDRQPGPQLEIDATAPDGSFARFDTVTATVRSPGGGESEITLEPVAPGRHAGPVPAAGTGPYVVAVTAEDATTAAEHRIVRALYWSADRETRQGADLPFLSRVADLTGGRVLGAGESPFDGPRTPAYVDISRWLAAAALVMFVLDILSGRRVAEGRWRRWRRAFSSVAAGR